MFLTPDGEPVWGGTYFPNTRATAGRLLSTCCARCAAVSRGAGKASTQNRKSLMARLAETRAAGKTRRYSACAELDQIARQLAGAIDPVNGGLRGAPKFPQGRDVRDALARRAAQPATRVSSSRSTLTLERISEGGIYDHLGGGFSRYSVDDNGWCRISRRCSTTTRSFSSCWRSAWQRTGKPLYRQRARETVGWLAREMTTGEGAFSRLARRRLRRRGGQVLRLVARRDHDVARRRRRSVFRPALRRDAGRQFRRPQHPQSSRTHRAQRGRRGAARRSARLSCWRVREQRVRPGLDDKVLADWNGLMIAALVNAGIAVRRAVMDRHGRARLRFHCRAR